ncbi:MAG TPA: exonuclease domain-containing protein [Pyrinomonadaceae bacterium]|jgi:DNA polymerase III epsilon subunit family exonuclease|nr:exonuclease domain-containing protein [Pyrinomonadaceae bacterium]
MQQTFSNLVSDSILVQEAIDLLRSQNGRASAANVAEFVLQLPQLDPPVAALLVSELIKDDWRLRLTDEHDVELLCEDDECRALSETDYVVVDVETTGPKTPPCRIMEIGAYRVSRGRIVAEFETLVNPQMEIPPFIVQLTGITDAMVKHAPVFDEVAHRWLAFADTAVLVAHNAPFDVRFINHEIARVFPGRRMFNPHLCTVSLSRRVVPDLPNYRLHTLAEHFAIPIRNRHRAAGDARATAEVFLGMLQLLHRHGVHDLAAARRFKRNEQ